MEENLVRIPDQVIEQLRCSQCKGYLSCGPVRLLPNGTWICGQCTPPNSDIVVYRELILEKTILKYAAFPCRFKMNGCRSNVAFGQAMEHESKCIYQFYHCPLPVPYYEICSWSGLQSELPGHLTKNHSTCLLEAAHFIVQVDQYCQGIFAVLKDDLVFLLTYSYLTRTRSLNYDVRYFNIDRAVFPSYIINIKNNEIPDCNVSLKENPCPIFGNCFNKLNNTLNLNKYMEALDNPNSIEIKFILKDLDKFALDTVKENLTVDYEKLESLQCMMCHIEYLVFPIFVMEGNKAVCFKCVDQNCKSEEPDMKLQQRIAETNFPCRWRSCHFIGLGNVIRTHEIHCRFRDYQCPICLNWITATFAAKHLKSHDAQCLSEGAITLQPRIRWPKYSCIIENNKVIIVKHDWDCDTGCPTGELLLSTFKDEKVVIQFEFKLCKRKKLEEFLLSRAAPKINYQEMQSCIIMHNTVSIKLRSYK